MYYNEKYYILCGVLLNVLELSILFLNLLKLFETISLFSARHERAQFSFSQRVPHSSETREHRNTEETAGETLLG